MTDRPEPPKMRIRRRKGAQPITMAEEITNIADRQRPRRRFEQVADDAIERGVPVDMAEAFPDPASDPAGRMAMVGRSIEARASGYIREYRLKLVHRMLMRNLSTDLIAQSLQTTPDAIRNLRFELRERLRADARKVDIYEHFGSTVAFYNEVRALALRMASDSKVANGVRVGALNAALAAEGDKHRFLQVAGFYDNMRYRTDQGAQDEHVSPLHRLGVLMEQGNDIAEFGEQEEEARRALMEGEQSDLGDDDVFSVIL